MKKLITYIIFLCFVFVGVYTFLDEETENTQKTNIDNNALAAENNDEISEEEIQKNIEILTKRIELKDMISIGDQYFNNEELLLALRQYKKVLNENPNDSKIVYKIGELLFIMKNFTEASEYYKKVLNFSNFDQRKYIYSLIYGANLMKPSQRENIKDEIYKTVINGEKSFFYVNSIDCVENFHDCKTKFKEKIKELNDAPESDELKEVQAAEKNYQNFGLEDISYKDTIYIGSFYKMKLYPIVIKLGEDILKEKPNYKAVLKLVAQSYYELGDYKNATEYLRKYFELESTDENAAYLLGITNLKQNEHYFSIFYLNKALNLGYKDTLNVKRKLIYNYYMESNNEKVFSIFNEIADDPKITIDDYNIMVNYALTNGQINKALEIARKGAEKYKDQIIFYEYLAKINYDNREYAIAKTYADKGLQIDKCNQLFNYLYGLMNINGRDYKTAQKYLNTAKNCHPDGEYTQEIELQLRMVKNRIEEEEFSNRIKNSELKNLDLIN